MNLLQATCWDIKLLFWFLFLFMEKFIFLIIKKTPQNPKLAFFPLFLFLCLYVYVPIFKIQMKI